MIRQFNRELHKKRYLNVIPQDKDIAMLGIVRRWFQQEKMLRELEKEKARERAKEAAEQAQREHIARASEHRKILQRQRNVLAILRKGKVPDIPEYADGTFPFKLQRNEKLIFVQNEVGYAEVRVRRQVVGRSSGVSVRVMKGVSVRSGESVGTPVETDIFTPRGFGVFAISTKHVFYNGQRTFRIPLSKIVSAQKTSEGDVEIVRDRASSLPEYFGVGQDADFVVSLIHLLPGVEFGRGEPEMEHVDSFMLLGDLGGDDAVYEEC